MNQFNTTTRRRLFLFFCLPCSFVFFDSAQISFSMNILEVLGLYSLRFPHSARFVLIYVSYSLTMLLHRFRLLILAVFFNTISKGPFAWYLLDHVILTHPLSKNVLRDCTSSIPQRSVNFLVVRRIRLQRTYRTGTAATYGKKGNGMDEAITN